MGFYRSWMFVKLTRLQPVFPKLNIMTGGLNYSELRDVIGVMRRRDNVTFETSCLQMVDGIETVVEKIGAERIFFGHGFAFTVSIPRHCQDRQTLKSAMMPKKKYLE